MQLSPPCPTTLVPNRLLSLAMADRNLYLFFFLNWGPEQFLLQGGSPTFTGYTLLVLETEAGPISNNAHLLSSHAELLSQAWLICYCGGICIHSTNLIRSQKKYSLCLTTKEVTKQRGVCVCTRVCACVCMRARGGSGVSPG